MFIQDSHGGLTQWREHNYEAFLHHYTYYYPCSEILPAAIQHFNSNAYVSEDRSTMIGWINRHTDTSIILSADQCFYSTPTQIIHLPGISCLSPNLDIVVNSFGQPKLLPASHHNESVYSWILFRNGIKDAIQYALSIYSSGSKNFICHSKPYALVLNTRWSSHNFYHWIHESLPRLQILLEHFTNFNSFHLLWLGPHKPSEYHIASLQSLGIYPQDIDIINGCISVERLLHCTFCHPGSFNTDQITRAKALTNKVMKLRSNPRQLTKFERILICRKPGSPRSFVPNQILFDLVDRFHFAPIQLENYDLASQIEIMSSAKVVLAPHGAGLTHCIHLPSFASIIEIMPSNSIHPLYWYLSSLCNLKYSMVPVHVDNSSQLLRLPGLLVHDTLSSHGITT